MILMNDYMIRTISDKANVIGLACRTTQLVERACLLHETSPTASAALGRALTGGLLMGALMKQGQRVALKFEGNGPLQKIIVEADNEGIVRGLVGNPSADTPPRNGKLDVSGILGSCGVLTVMKDVGLKEPSQGIVELRTGEIAEDMAFYLAESEQIPSAVGLGVFVTNDGRVAAAGGFLIQSLPPSDGPAVDRLEANISNLPSVTAMIRNGRTPEDMLAAIFDGLDHRLIGQNDLFYRCTCNRQRIERIIRSLGREEVLRFKSQQEQTQVTCEFCRTTYTFDQRDLARLLDGDHTNIP